MVKRTHGNQIRSPEPRVNFNEQPNRRMTYGSTGLGGVHLPIPQAIIGLGVKTSEEFQLVIDQPHTDDRNNMNVHLGDMIPRTGIMRIKEEIILAIRTEGRNKKLHQGEMTLRLALQGMQHEWPRTLNL